MNSHTGLPLDTSTAKRHRATAPERSSASGGKHYCTYRQQKSFCGSAALLLGSTGSRKEQGGDERLGTDAEQRGLQSETRLSSFKDCCSFSRRTQASSGSRSSGISFPHSSYFRNKNNHFSLGETLLPGNASVCHEYIDAPPFYLSRQTSTDAHSFGEENKPPLMELPFNQKRGGGKRGATPKTLAISKGSGENAGFVLGLRSHLTRALLV